MLPAVFAPEPPALRGLSPSVVLPARFAAGGVAAFPALLADGMESVEFFRDTGPEADAEGVLFPPFFDLVPEPTGRLAPEPRFRFLITSVFKLNGLTTPCSFRKSPHALQSGCPSGLRRHKGVV